MPPDAPFQPPRKKHSAMLGLGIFSLLLVIIFLFQLFGPNPPIQVSPATTHITSPLGRNGLPDYQQYILQKSRAGVTRENNAAALLWPALWPGELDPPQYAAVANELGLDRVPSRDDALAHLYGKATEASISSWLRKRYSQPASRVDPVPENTAATPKPTDSQNAVPPGEDGLFDTWLTNATEQIIDRANECPWRSDQIPPLAKWIAESKKPLDQMIAASHRSRCYFPSPSSIAPSHSSLIDTLLPGQQGAREAGRALCMRAMWHVGEGRTDDAWQDLLAAHRIGRLVAQGPTLVEQLVGMAISGMACDGTVTMLHHGNLSAAQARQVMHDLATLQDFSRLADSIDEMERATYLETVIRFSRGELDDQLLKLIGIGGNALYAKAFAIDWNVVLRKGNEFYDRLAAAARLQSHVAREKALSQIGLEIDQSSRNISASSLVAAALSPSARSDAVASFTLGLLIPAIQATTNAQDRTNSALELTRLAAALTVYRAEHGTYPEKLDQLVPSVRDNLSVDLYNAQPFLYKRTDDGYLLYSTGHNGQDDGGSNEQMRIFEGRAVEAPDNSTVQPPQPPIPAGSDDISIRVPHEPFQLPKPSPTE